MSNVIKLNIKTRADLPADQMLRNIAEEDPGNAFLIVWPKDGSMPSYHSSTGDMPVVLLRLQEFIHKYYSGEFN